MITMKDIIREGNPLLKQKAVDVNIPLSNEDEKLIIEMMEYVYNSVDEEMMEKYDLRPAVGLAAPQLGILKKMIAIVAPDEKGVEHEFAIINPRLLSYSDELTYLEGGEGCLSVDRKCDALIHRPKRVSFDAISIVINPVTQTDVVDENNASTKGNHLPSTFEIGKHSKNAPISINAIKLSKIYFAGVILNILLAFKFIFIY